MKASNLLLGIILYAVCTITQGGPMVPNRTLQLTFDKTCDGMTIIINHSLGTVTGSRTGCRNQLVRGLPGAISGGAYDGQGVVVGTTSADKSLLYVISDYPRQWQSYDLVTGAVIQSGTWTEADPQLAHASQSFNRSSDE